MDNISSQPINLKSISTSKRPRIDYIESENLFSDINMDCPYPLDETPRGKVKNLFLKLRDDPSSFDDLMTDLDEIFDSVDHSILSLVTSNKSPLKDSVINTPSFAQITSKQMKSTKHNPLINKNSSISNVYIKTDDLIKSKDIFSEIKTKVQPHKDNIAVARMSIVKDNLIKVTTETKEDANRLKCVLSQRIQNITVEDEKTFKPRIIVFGVDSKMTNEELTEQIYQNNSDIKNNFELEVFSKNFQAIKRTKETDTKQQNVIFSTHPLIRANMFKNNQRKVRINWRILNWNDSFFVLRCQKCLRSGHHHTTCQHKQQCSKCGLEHEDKACPQFKEDRCHLCSLKSKHPQQILHKLGDKSCSTHKNAINRMTSRTNYDESTQF